MRGDEEARLIYLGARGSLDFKSGPGLILDIGGGSVELIVADARQCYYTRSLKLGVLRLYERFVAHDPIQPAERERLVSHIHATLDPVAAKIHTMGYAFVALTSGTAHAVAAIADPAQAEAQRRIKRHDAAAAADRLCTMPLAARLELKGLDPKRVDTIVPGAVLVATLLEVFAASEAVLCSRALREGVIADYISQHRSGLSIEEEVPELRRRSVISLLRRMNAPEAHSKHVAALARSMFRQLSALHKLGEEEGELLEFAALLHDIGLLIGASRHHKHSQYLILNDDLRGLSRDEVRVIAGVARYHRKAAPKKSHLEFARLTEKQRTRVVRLAAILRVADGLDRSHNAVIKAVSCRDRGRVVDMTVFASGDAELEVWGARRKADMFREAFDRKLGITVKDAGEADDDQAEPAASPVSAFE